MREILFRGKTEQGEWLYGFYHNETSIESPSSDRKITRHHIYTQSFDKIVIPETVGQFTGLTDKNGKKIFEGDIVKDGVHTFEVRYYDYGWCCYCVNSGKYVLPLHKYFPLEHWDKCERNGYRRLEVIGNIHDNPELLGE